MRYWMIAGFGAALMPMPSLAADPVVAEPGLNYTVPDQKPFAGLSLGAFLGLSAGDADFASGDFSNEETLDLEGVEGGIYGGYAYQFDRGLVLGVEGDAALTDVEEEESGVSIERSHNASLRGRAGVALDQFLLYGTGGVAVGEVELSNASGEADETLTGYTAGAGVERAITDRVSARIEYRYTDLGDKTFSLPSGPQDLEIDDHKIRAGIGFRF